MSMVAGKYNITCQAGSTFDLLMTVQYPNPEFPNCPDVNACPEYVNWDLTGYRARMQVRKYIDSASPLVILTTENGRIILGAEDGTIQLFMRAEDTKTIVAVGATPTTTAIYDLEIISQSNEVDRVIQGVFTISQDVTR